MQAFRTSAVAVSRRATVVSAPRSAAAFSTSRISREEGIKGTAQQVNKKAGEAVLKGVIEPAEKAADAVKSAVGVGASKAGELKEEAKGAATNASYEAEKVKAEAGKKANQAATEAKKATQ